MAKSWPHRGPGKKRDVMVGPFDPNVQPDKSGTEGPGTDQSGLLGSPASRRTALGLILGAPLLGACAGVQQSISQFSLPNPFSSSSPPPGPAGPPAQSVSVGNGQVKVAVLLPLSAGGNAAVAAQSMKNAFQMALIVFLNPNLHLLIKDEP